MYNDNTQVIEYLKNGNIRVYHIIEDESRLATDNDPLTTIVIKGYKDVTIPDRPQVSVSSNPWE